MKQNSWLISRRTVLKGVGATLALPFLDVMAKGNNRCQRIDIGMGSEPSRTGYRVVHHDSGFVVGQPRCVSPGRRSGETVCSQAVTPLLDAVAVLVPVAREPAPRAPG